MVSVVIGGDGVLAGGLARAYRAAGSEVLQVSFEHELTPQLPQAAGQLDLLIVADDFDPPPGAVADLTRDKLAQAMHRLSFLPFRLAALLQPRLAAAKGRAVLLTRADARMDVPDSVGRYTERPFRTAAHALWRCLSVEWKDAGIDIGLIGLDGPPHDVESLVLSIAAIPGETFPVELVDRAGLRMGW